MPRSYLLCGLGNSRPMPLMPGMVDKTEIAGQERTHNEVKPKQEAGYDITKPNMAYLRTRRLLPIHTLLSIILGYMSTIKRLPGHYESGQQEGVAGDHLEAGSRRTDERDSERFAGKVSVHHSFPPSSPPREYFIVCLSVGSCGARAAAQPSGGTSPRSTPSRPPSSPSSAT